MRTQTDRQAVGQTSLECEGKLKNRAATDDEADCEDESHSAFRCCCCCCSGEADFWCYTDKRPHLLQGALEGMGGHVGFREESRPNRVTIMMMMIEHKAERNKKCCSIQEVANQALFPQKDTYVCMREQVRERVGSERDYSVCLPR